MKYPASPGRAGFTTLLYVTQAGSYAIPAFAGKGVWSFFNSSGPFWFDLI
ncbi:MAG: hypothetical protein LUG98_01705 [Tannerellaceae bacterium]|nr:hypothetical protein [Tannerellaceae bacterium]